MDAQTIDGRGPRFGRLGVDQAMVLKIAKEIAGLSPVLQSFPPRSILMFLEGNSLTLKNYTNQPTSFVLFFIKTNLMQEVGLMAAAARAAREIGEKLK